jgi:hypothetical protein
MAAISPRISSDQGLVAPAGEGGSRRHARDGLGLPRHCRSALRVFHCARVIAELALWKKFCTSSSWREGARSVASRRRDPPEHVLRQIFLFDCGRPAGARRSTAAPGGSDDPMR